MSMTLPKVAGMAPASSPYLRLVVDVLRKVGVRVGPPIVVIALLLVVWQITCSRPGAGLPPPTRVLNDTWDLIIHPFFDNGGTDKGLFWHISASLQRVALGYALATVAGIALGTLVGQSTWAMRGLDPIFQVLRTVPPLAWLPLSLAAFRDGQPSAIFVIFITAIWPIIINTSVGIRNIPQDYRNVSAVLRLNGLEFFWKIMIPSAAPYIFTGLAHRHRSVVAGDRRSRDADRRRRHRFLHLGCLEFIAHLGDHPRADLRRDHRLPAGPRCGDAGQYRDTRDERAMTSQSYLNVSQVGITFSRSGVSSEVLRDVDLRVEKGEYVSIIGHSGCGKSTLLNIIAGLARASTGGVLLENREVNSPGPDRAVVFQNHSLLPWLTVRENVGLAVDKVFGGKKSRAERNDWIDANLRLVNMLHAANKRPGEISGGMKQRVGIARALAMEPKVLLLDEPFGALDALTRAHLQDQVMEIHTRLGNTIMMITHDVDEAVLLSDRIVMMTNGPSATIGEILTVPLARPRKRLNLVEDAVYVHARAAVLEFLYARHAAPAMAAA